MLALLLRHRAPVLRNHGSVLLDATTTPFYSNALHKYRAADTLWLFGVMPPWITCQIMLCLDSLHCIGPPTWSKNNPIVLAYECSLYITPSLVSLLVTSPHLKATQRIVSRTPHHCTVNMENKPPAESSSPRVFEQVLNPELTFKCGQWGCTKELPRGSYLAVWNHIRDEHLHLEEEAARHLVTECNYTPGDERDRCRHIVSGTTWTEHILVSHAKCIVFACSHCKFQHPNRFITIEHVLNFNHENDGKT
ncbi:hypothetical protein K474DRAFT_1660101, partial [Panus rudis PR-1116 ss-1]